MKALLSTMLSAALVLVSVTCACDVQAMPMSTEQAHHADHAQHEMPACDHTDCTNDCFEKITVSKLDVYSKLSGLFDFDEDAVALADLSFPEFQQANRATGPPGQRFAPASTPVSRQDLLLE
jgi:hypothetical protein